jgi:hypothetical protein
MLIERGKVYLTSYELNKGRRMRRVFKGFRKFKSFLILLLVVSEDRKVFVLKISCWLIVIFTLSILLWNTSALAREAIKLYDNTVILTPFVGEECVIDVFLNEGDRIVFGFSVEQGSFWVRKVDMFITGKANFKRRKDLLEWSSLVYKEEVKNLGIPKNLDYEGGGIKS